MEKQENEELATEALSHLSVELGTGTDLRNLLHKQQPFITSQSGGGQYKVVLEFKSIVDMHDFYRQLIRFIAANKDEKTHCAICGGIARKQQGSDENTEWLECENNGSHYAHFENYEWIDTESA